jgi:hypothetical protein
VFSVALGLQSFEKRSTFKQTGYEPIFRRVRKIAKSDYNLRPVRLSVRM